MLRKEQILCHYTECKPGVLSRENHPWAIDHPVQEIIPCCHAVKAGSPRALRQLPNVHASIINKMCSSGGRLTRSAPSARKDK